MGRVSHEGKRVKVYGKTKSEALKKLRALQRKQEDGLPLVTSQMLLKDYLPFWLESLRHQVRPKTHVDYEVSVRLHITPSLGHIRLAKLGPEDIDKAWNDMLKEGKSPSVVQYAHLRLSKALNEAMKRNLIYRNPCQAVSPPKARRKDLYPPDEEAIHRFLQSARETSYYEALYTSFYTGLRRGEVLALTWRDVDLDLGTISVVHSLYRARGGKSILNDPKSTKGRRLVSLTPSTTLLLRSLRERQEADGIIQGYAINDDSPVFRYRDGSPILPRGYSGAFTKIMHRAGLEGYRLHDARHAHATLMLKQGIHPSIVQSRLGHAKVSTTLDIYSHVVPGLQEAAALRFEEGLAKAGLPTRPHPTPELALG
jgi:integrase